MIIMLFIGLNMLTMTMDHYQQTELFSNTLDYLNMIFICIFTSECLMKVFALRYHYFVEPWNLFDFVVVILSILGKVQLIQSLHYQLAGASSTEQIIAIDWSQGSDTACQHLIST